MVDLLARSQRLCQIPTLHMHLLVGAALVWFGHLVCLVNHHHIPALLQNLVFDCWLFGVVH